MATAKRKPKVAGKPAARKKPVRSRKTTVSTRRGLRRVLLAAASTDPASLRRLRVLAEALAREGCHPVQGSLVAGAGGDAGLDWLHSESRSGDVLGLALLGQAAGRVGRQL